ncbi:MAG: hypothetical protein ACN4E2_06775 [Nitrospinota bacterium]
MPTIASKTVLLCSLLLILSAACQSEKGFLNISKHSSNQTLSSGYAKDVSSIILHDFMIYHHQDRSATAKDQLTNLSFKTGKIMEDSTVSITSLFYRELLSRGFQVNLADSSTRRELNIDSSFDKETFIKQATANKSFQESDLILTGIIYRYEDKIGSSISIDKASSVAFSVVLISKSEGRTIFEAGFDKEQQSLFSDLTEFKFFAKGGFKWLTALELSSLAVEKLVDKLPVQPISNKK